MRALLDLEDDPPSSLRVLIPGTDVPLWPLARWPLSRALAETDIGTSVPTYQSHSLKHRLVTAARRIIPNRRASAHAPRADHLFVASGWTRTPRAGGYVNWLTDDFARSLGDDAVVVQDAYFDRFSATAFTPANPRTYTYALSNERIAQAVDRNPQDSAARATVERAMRDAFDALAHPVTESGRRRAIGDVIGRAQRASHAQREFSRLLDTVRPRRLYMQTAAYGTRAAEIALAHDRGIDVTELQHGWMGSSHAAYNAGGLMREPALARCLPDTILGYGEYWGRDIRYAGRFLPVGKPTLDPLVLRPPSWSSRPARLLFVSSNFEHDLVDSALIALRNRLPDDWEIALRPHPVERASAASRHEGVLRRDGIELDLSADAGAALAASRAVVGFSSTMLFEALAYGCHVAVLESALAEHYASADVFPLRLSRDLTDVGDIVAHFIEPPTTVERALAEAVWKPGAVEAFRAFAAG
ncbi:hypothetical protein OB08_10960 [Microbacterium sp. HJ5]